ncbi:serine hydrolase [Reyranella sp. CPCC 100927]|uniref:serine hydrolase domain-containing protein n=1 Tax=Reyranella sp. CPCC 100927 TaxID=2599616 RepID=UPI0011B6AC21|nr:serine hydrolase [Reyranella sp. CPCC 100927]TWT05009.1 serine hydrolase [Reyranella sp. CPCC 100927]
MRGISHHSWCYSDLHQGRKTMHRSAALLATVLFLAAWAASAAPQEEQYGRDEGYPVGDRATAFQQRYLVGTFSNTEKLAPFHTVAAPPHASPLLSTDAMFDITYTHGDKRKTIEDYLATNPVTGLLILRDTRIAFERYQYDRTAAHRFYSASMAKTVTALLIGIALRNGKIRSVDDTAETYVPDLRGSAYGATPLRALLQMSSGIRYVEQYNGADDQARLWRAMFAQDGPTVLDVLKSFSDRPWPPGTHFNYAGADTMVLGLALRAATGQPLATYLSEKIWQPMSAGANASWLIDRSGQELSSCCLNVTLRDYGRLALLMANDGHANGMQIVPADWIRDMTTVPDDRAHLKPYVATRSYGYGYQTWILPGAERQFALLGVHGQAIYVHPRLKLAMVNTAVRPRPVDPGIFETSALWRAVAAAAEK